MVDEHPVLRALLHVNPQEVVFRHELPPGLRLLVGEYVQEHWKPRVHVSRR